VNVLAASITLCLSGINISKHFKYFNNAELFDKVEEEKLLYSSLKGKASKCTGQCEE
jgi:predicted aldo/keto reductase-like oxidoreductase